MTDKLDRDPFAFAGSEDAVVLSLFRQWCTETIAAETMHSDDDVDRQYDVITGIAERIFDSPIDGAIGLAIKAFLFTYEVNVHEEFAEQGRDAAAGNIGDFISDGRNYSCRRVDGATDTWSQDALLFLLQRAMRGMLVSAVQFVPDLTPMVAGVIDSPLALPPDDDDEKDDGDELAAGAGVDATTAPGPDAMAADPVLPLAAERRKLIAAEDAVGDIYSKVHPGDPRELALSAQLKDISDQIEAVQGEMLSNPSNGLSLS